MIYGNGAVSVDAKFARFGSKSYAINKINTIDVQVARPHGWAPLILFGFLTALFSIIALGASEQGNATPFFMIAIVCGAVTYWGWKRTKIRDYHLPLMTSSSSAQAYTTRDPDEIDQLRDAIETVMSREHSMHHRHEITMPSSGSPGPEPIAMKRAHPSNIRQRTIGRPE